MSVLIQVNKSVMTPYRITAGTRGSYAAENVRFRFSVEWDGLTKKLVFFPQRGTPLYCVYRDGDEVVIPARVMRCAGDNVFVLSGYELTDGKIGRKVVTATGIVYVAPTMSDTLNEPDIPEPTVFEEIIAKIGAPYIGENGNWYIWDEETRDFADSGVPATGPHGETGRGLVILGKYDTVADLEEAVTDPEVGDAYDVGEDTPYTYIWDGENWVSHGDIRGVGIESVEQVQESMVSGGENVIRVTKTDGTYSDFSVRNGAKGERGVPGNVHYGSDAPPSDAVIWIDPSGLALPAAPTTDGTYKLSVTVTGGQPTFAWVIDT